MNFLLDFDSTVVVDEYPNIGKANPHALRVLKKVQKNHSIILNSFRAEAYDGSLEDAIDYLTRNNIFLHMALSSRIMPYEWDVDYFIRTGNFHIDDKSFGIPLIRSEGKSRWMVDWIKVEIILQIKGLI